MISVQTTLIVTLAVVSVAAAILIGYDVVVATDKLPGNTISEMTLDYARKHPIIPLALGLVVGILFGHLFWPQR